MRFDYKISYLNVKDDSLEKNPEVVLSDHWKSAEKKKDL